MDRTGPRLSVVVPAHQAATVLPLALSALARSDLPRPLWELIVVDDASADDTAVVASRFADTIVRLPGKAGGPAYARNRGFEVSRGEIVVFIDSDVCVHPETLGRILSLLDENPDISAVFGSYDSTPSHTSPVSEFRNLLHHFVHQRDAGEAETFWAGCGAIRSDAFRAVGMFDEWHYSRPQIEDIELGRRLRQHGHRIVLRPDIQGTHLKKWTLRDVMTTDFKHRGVPWTRLLLQEGPTGSVDVLNIRASEKICTALAGLAWLATAAAIVLASLWPLAVIPPGAATVTYMNRDFYRFIARERGWRMALIVIPLHLLYYMTNVVSAGFGWFLHVLLGEPEAPVSAVAGVGMEVRRWPPAPSRPRTGVWNLTVPHEAARPAPAKEPDSGAEPDGTRPPFVRERSA